MAASAPGRRRRPWRWLRRASAAWRGTTGVSSSPTSGAPQRRSKTAATPRSGSTCAWVRRDGRDARGRQGGRRRFGPGVWAQFRGRGDLPGVGGGGEGGSGSGPRAARRRSPAGHGSPHGGGVDDHAPRGAEAAAIPQEPCFFRSGPSPAPSSCSGSGLDFSSGSGSRGHGTAGRAKGPQKKRRKWAGAAPTPRYAHPSARPSLSCLSLALCSRPPLDASLPPLTAACPSLALGDPPPPDRSSAPPRVPRRWERRTCRGGRSRCTSCATPRGSRASSREGRWRCARTGGPS